MRVSAGAGPTPISVIGHVYFGGPYEGAPYSLIIITPAVAGPYDLGTVVVRSALHVDPESAQVTVTSDPLPTILQGIPLDVRGISVSLTRAGFTINPSQCNAMTITAAARSVFGQVAPLGSRFQAGGCTGLKFKPGFAASTSGQTSRLNGASLRIKVTEGEHETNIKKIDLRMPNVLPSRNSTLRLACRDNVFAANPAACPAGAVIGTVKAVSPLLNQPLVGPAYLVSHAGRAFPDVVVLLQGENGLLIRSVGQTFIQKSTGAVTVKFEALPDAQVRSLEVNLPEGPHSILGAFGTLCAKELSLPAILMGQNEVTLEETYKIGVTDCPKPSVKLKVSQAGKRTVALLVTTSQKGSLTLTGPIRLTKKALTAGRHKLTLTCAGSCAASVAHHYALKVHMSFAGLHSGVSRKVSLRP